MCKYVSIFFFFFWILHLKEVEGTLSFIPSPSPGEHVVRDASQETFVCVLLVAGGQRMQHQPGTLPRWVRWGGRRLFLTGGRDAKAELTKMWPFHTSAGRTSRWGKMTLAISRAFKRLTSAAPVEIPAGDWRPALAHLADPPLLLLLGEGTLRCLLGCEGCRW